MIVGGYVLHLYCDFPDESYDHQGGEVYKGYGFGEFGGDSKQAAYKEARNYGWRFTRDGRCICGWCLSQGRSLEKQTQAKGENA